MKLVPVLSIFALGLGGLTAAATQGCSSDSSSTPPAAAGKQVAAPPVGAGPSTSTEEKTFAVNALYLGESDRAGAVSTNAWKNFGLDIDGLTTAKDSTNVCTRVASAQSANQEDGPEGIDNSFGKTIIQLINSVAPAPTKTINQSLTDGAFTIMLKIKGLTDDPKQSNTALGGKLLIGATFSDAGKPTFTTADDWPYRQEPQVDITGAYINNGTFVNGSGGATVNLSLFIGGVSLDLAINKAFITFDHSAPNDATNGLIAGVIATDKLLEGIGKIAGRISPSLCGGTTLENIKTTLKQASDILVDGTNRPGVQCDAISVGIGFSAKRVGNPTKIAGADSVPPDPCLGDGGT